MQPPFDDPFYGREREVFFLLLPAGFDQGSRFQYLTETVRPYEDGHRNAGHSVKLTAMGSSGPFIAREKR